MTAGGAGGGLPDCGAPAAPAVELTYHERAELVRRLAEEGPGALERFVSENARSDSSVARAVEHFRRLLEEQSRRMRESIEREHSERLARQEKLAREDLARLAGEERVARQRKIRMQEELARVLEEGLLADPLVSIVAEAPPSAEVPLTAWQGFVERARRLIAAVASALRRFWRWLLRKAGRKARAGRARPAGASLLVALPSLGRTVEDLDLRFQTALLTSPDLKKGMEARLLENAGPFRRLRLALSRRFRPRAYSRTAREAFRERALGLLSRGKSAADREREEMEARLRDLRARRASLERESAREGGRLRSEREKLLSELGRRVPGSPEELVTKDIEEGLVRSGLVSRDGAGRLQITARLVDRFADLVLTGELRNLPPRHGIAPGRMAALVGTYERDRLRTVEELSRMDIVESLLAARLSHPARRSLVEEDVRVNRELSGSSLHVVLAFDKSSSMEENQRMVAAKKAVLALFKAVKRKDRRNTVDLLGFDTGVMPMDLVGVWEARPGGFTNTAGALAAARELLEAGRADLKLIYLITDGFPEAYTENGRDIAGDNEGALARAVAEARELRRFPNLRLVHVLLEPHESSFVDAAQKIVEAARGRLVTTDPNHLAAEILVDYSAAVSA